MTEPIHQTSIRVIYGDTDAAGVVYNANYLRYFEIGRTEMMRDLACSYRDIEEMGFVLPVTESYLRFKAPAHYDDMITIATSVDWIKKVSCKFNYQITRQDPGKEKPTLLTKGFTIHASITKAGKLSPLPPHITDALQQFITS